MMAAAASRLRSKVRLKEEWLYDLLFLMPAGSLAAVGLLAFLGLIK